MNDLEHYKTNCPFCNSLLEKYKESYAKLHVICNCPYRYEYSLFKPIVKTPNHNGKAHEYHDFIKDDYKITLLTLHDNEFALQCVFSIESFLGKEKTITLYNLIKKENVMEIYNSYIAMAKNNTLTNHLKKMIMIL